MERSRNRNKVETLKTQVREASVRNDERLFFLLDRKKENDGRRYRDTSRYKRGEL